jgi:adenosylcobinamide-GDP ribazoletransferase
VTTAPPTQRWHTALGACRASLGLFTVIPVAGPAQLGRDTAARAVLWLPVVGGLLAAPAAAALWAVEAGGHSSPRELLAATLAIGMLGLLTGGLHLDGLADTADGLGSRRPREEALAIMRRPDVGPFGVAVLVLVLLVQITALAATGPGALGAAALVLAVVTGRVAVVMATGPGSPAARPEGFGALVAAATPTRTAAAVTAALLVVAAAGGAGLGGPALALRAAAAVLAGLLAAELVRLIALRRLGGLTGDVYGALIEVCTAVVLLVLAITA